MATYRKHLSVVGERDSASVSQTYVFGDVVPELDEEPVRRSPQRRIKKRASSQVVKNRKRALSMSPGYVLFLATAAAVALLVCVNYVNLQAQLAGSARNITVMQEELADLREENNTRYNTLMDSINMDEIQERAQELGMVYADEEQIIEYDSPSSHYVVQYEDIPEDGVLTQ